MPTYAAEIWLQFHMTFFLYVRFDWILMVPQSSRFISIYWIVGLLAQARRFLLPTDAAQHLIASVHKLCSTNPEFIKFTLDEHIHHLFL
jgi:hypothetical protein